MSSILNREKDHGGKAVREDKNSNFDNQVRLLIPAEVYMISGYHCLERSADFSSIHRIDRKGNLSSREGRAGGACTTALLSILYDWYNKGETNHQKQISF
mmetsp:Transcript_18011/g.44825  ORF Transcript_18011/g.44825 Transcript_18011/m.44825 type:complete len:100 (+) Transcript_18011:120-419(+)